MKRILYFFSTLLVLSSCNITREPKLFPANHEWISYIGRTTASETGRIKMWAPGVYFTFHFSGTSCELLINDEMKWDHNLNYLQVIIDDTLVCRIQTTSKVNRLKLAEGLPRGVHTITVCKDTESNIGFVEVEGVVVEKLLPPPAKPDLRFEFIGNSITCGTGADTSEIGCGKRDWHDQHNAWMSYGAVTARNLNAQWHLSSVSGIGMIRSCCDMTITMPDVFGYSDLLTPDNGLWDFSQYIPDVVTICLGQNDGIQDSAAFCSAYVDFIGMVQEKYPHAKVVCLTSPMADEALTSVMKNFLTGIVNHFEEQGDQRVSKFFFSRSFNSGCDNHPSLEEHQLIAAELIGYLEELIK